MDGASDIRLEGIELGISDAVAKASEGTSDCIVMVGGTVGTMNGTSDSWLVGKKDGKSDGNEVCTFEGERLGLNEGTSDGIQDGASDGGKDVSS